jgi:hypothetical protein
MRIRMAALAAMAAVLMTAAGPGVAANASAPVPAPAVTPPGAVTAAGVTAATPTSLTLQWTNPLGRGFSGVVIRRAKGGTAPGFTTGTLVAATGKTVSAFTNKGLSPGTRYSYALFAMGTAGSHARADVVTGTTNPALKITTAALANGTAGMTYQAALSAAGGTPPYHWKAAGLPAGLSIAANGVIRGYPAAVGTRGVTVTVTDAQRVSRTKTLTLAVPSALPAGCAARACARLSPDGRTVQVPAADISGVTRATAGHAVSQVVLSGITVQAGDVLVLAPRSGIPSGLIAVAGMVTANADGTVTVAVTPAKPDDAYDTGTVQALPAHAATGTVTVPAAGTSTRGPAVASRAAAATLKCSGGVSSDLHGLSVTHALTPSLAALWKHPFFGGGGVYVGSGGLTLFQFDLDGTITLNMGVAVSGAATCTLTLPTLTAEVPAGELGAVIFTTTPVLTFDVTGKIDIRATVSLGCGAEYRWDNGAQSRAAYCEPSSTPLQLSADSGLDASLTGTLNSSVSLDDIAGITGDIWGSAHAGYHPAAHPVAEVDAAAGWDLGACLACFWSDSPAHVTIGSGTFFTRTIASYDTPPPPPPAGPPVITTTTLPAAIAGESYTTQLATADHRGGTWKITAGKLPLGLALSGYTISGVPVTAATSTFTVAFTDSHGHTVTATVAITVIATRPSAWTAVQSPLPANAAVPYPAPQPTALTCRPATTCVAAGDYIDASGNYQGLMLTRSGSTWTVAEAPLPANSTGGSGAMVRAVTCASATWCVAVGDYSDSTRHRQGLLIMGSGSTWRTAEAPLPANAHPDVYLTSVACASATKCFAAGTYDDIDRSPHGLMLTWSGSTWKAATAPLPANGAVLGGLSALACPSVSACLAVGSYTDKSQVPHGLALTWSGTAWTAAATPQPPAVSSIAISALACPSASVCVAVGSYTDKSGVSHGLALTRRGSTWTATATPRPANATGSSLSVLACPSASECVAGGSYSAPGGRQPAMILTGFGSTWTTASPPAPANSSSSGGALWDVACPSTAKCFAVGTYDTNGVQKAFIATGAGGTWTADEAPVPANSNPDGTVWPTAIACPTSSLCVTAGNYAANSSLEAFLLTWAGP